MRLPTIITPERMPVFLGAVVVFFGILPFLLGIVGIVQHTIFLVVLVVAVAVTALIVLRDHRVEVWRQGRRATGLVSCLVGVFVLMVSCPAR